MLLSYLNRSCLGVTLCIAQISLYAQNASTDRIYSTLHAKAEQVAGDPSMIVTNRALNLFFADKVSSYLSSTGDISLSKNYATLNTSNGILSLNHNFAEQLGTDHRIQSFFTIGVQADVVNGFAAIFSNKEFSNDIGLNVKWTLFGRGSVFYDNQRQQQRALVESASVQKGKMNVQRAYILASLKKQMEMEATQYESSLGAMDPALFPGQDAEQVKTGLRADFYKKLESKYADLFAQQESQQLTGSQSFNLISDHWTYFSAYIPLTSQKFSVAPTFAENFTDEHLYPWQFSVSESWIWESRKWGRFFLFVNGGFHENNSVNTKSVNKVSLGDYRALGGTDTVTLAQLKTSDAYVGNYSNFVTPVLSGQFVYFPPKWNVGISLYAEQNFGMYNPLNAKVGIPIRFNDKDGNAKVNFEIQLRSNDISNETQPGKTFWQKSTIGLSVGLPFSSLLY